MNQPAKTLIITRALLLPFGLLALVQLTGCSQRTIERLIESFIEALLMVLLIGLIIALVSIVVFLAEVALIVANVLRPNAFTTITAMVLGSAQVLFMAVGLVAGIGNALESPHPIELENDIWSILGILGSGLVYTLFHALLAWSGWAGWQKLQMPDADEEL